MEQQLRPMLYDFQGELWVWEKFISTNFIPFISGQQINFDFEVEKNAIVGYHSCGAWLNGEYYIIDSSFEIPGSNGFIRKVETTDSI